MSRWLAAALVAGIVAAGCSTGDDRTPRPTPPAAASPSAISTTTTVALIVGRNRIVRGPRVITVHRGDGVTLVLRSTVPAEQTLLVRGYGARGELDPADGATQLYFVADRTGTFALVREETGARVGTLRVLP